MQTAQKNFYKKLLGRVGETKSVKFLKKQGYKIIERNFKTRVGEIDIIARKNDELVFVEVKTRSSDCYGAPSEAVNRKKQEKYFKVAQEYILKKNMADCNCRFDVVEVENGQINHIENAFCL